MRVMVTGALGFTGRHMLTRLAEEPGVRVTGLDRVPSITGNLRLDDYISGDLAERDVARHAIRQAAPDVVIHLAGRMTGARPELWRANVVAVLRLLSAVVCERPSAVVVLVGSAAEYGRVDAGDQPVREHQVCRPEGVYGLTKLRATRLVHTMVRRFGVRAVIARPFNLIGPGMPSSVVAGAVLERARTAIAEGRDDVTVGTVTHVRDFVNVTDAVEAYWRLSRAERWGEIFNVCTGIGRSVHSLLEELLSYAPRPLRLVHSPDLMKTGDVAAMYGSPDKTHAATAFTPSPNLSAALRDAWRPLAHGS